jgi:fucose permease
MSAIFLLALIYLAFISLGLPDGVVGVAWPAMRVALGQPIEAAGLITLVVTGCSALSGFASGFVLKRLSAGVVVMLSGWLTGLALLGIAFAPSFAVLLLLAVPLGLGAGAVDAAMNHFVARHYSSRHMNWLHGCWGVGATIGPLIMGAALASASGWRFGYQAIGGLQMMLALAFLLTLHLWQLAPTVDPTAHENTHGPARKPLRQLAVWLAPAQFLLYAAVEVGTSLWAATVLIEQRGRPASTAGLWVSGFFGAIMLGRFATGLVSQRLGNRRLVRYGLMLAIAGAVIFSANLSPAWMSLVGLVLLGLGCAPIYPSLMHEAARRFEPDLAARVIGRQVGSAYIGCMVLPAALGLMGATWGLWLIMPAIATFAILLLWLSELLNVIT